MFSDARKYKRDYLDGLNLYYQLCFSPHDCDISHTQTHTLIDEIVGYVCGWYLSGEKRIALKYIYLYIVRSYKCVGERVD